MPITANQPKSARELLGWSQSKLAGRSGVSAATIARFEKGGRSPSILDLSVVRRVLAAEGIEFITADGAQSVRLLRPHVIRAT